MKLGAGPFRSVEHVLRPRSLAFVGASEAGWSKTLFENLKFHDADLPIYAVNPRRESVWGERCYPSLSELPHPVDLALVITPAATIPSALRDGQAHGLKAAAVYAAGFGEGNDPAGLPFAAELRALCDSGLRVLGPNCMGAVSTRERLYLYPSRRVRDVRAGDVALVMQSGGLFQYWVQQAAERGMGFSYAVTSGNQLDLDLADYINFFVEDEFTKVICVLAEGVPRPDAFVAAAEKALQARKPIVLIKIGRSEAAKRAAESHTGSLAGDDRVFDAVCERYGIIRVASLEQLMESALVFRSNRLPVGRHIAMVGYSGATRGLALDQAEIEGVAFSKLSPQTVRELDEHLDPGTALEMPLDLGTRIPSDPARYSRICQIIATDPQVDILIVQGQLPVKEDESPNPAFFNAILTSTDKPVFAYGRTTQNVSEVSRTFQTATGLLFVQGIPQTLAAANQLIRYAERLKRDARNAPEHIETRSAIEDLPALLGIQTPGETLATSSAACVDAAERQGFPVALKLHSRLPLHKTEIDGIALDLRNRNEVKQRADTLFAMISSRPELACEGVLVQEMVSGVEMIVGAREDPQYGPVIVIGVGGIFVEVLNDIVLRLLPVSAADVREMLGELRGKALMTAFRGRPERDVDAFVEAVVAVGTAFLTFRSAVETLEINPLIVLERGKGVRAVDVRTVARAAVTLPAPLS